MLSHYKLRKHTTHKLSNYKLETQKAIMLSHYNEKPYKLRNHTTHAKPLQTRNSESHNAKPLQ